MFSLQSLYADAMFRLSGLTWIEGLDLLLVTTAFFLLLHLMHRSRAGFLLRGTLALCAVLLIVTILLPLPTFDWLIRVSLMAILVGTPIIFQPELRRLLERLGRNTGLGRAVRQTKAERVISALSHAVEGLSNSKTGALIVLEGSDSLQEVIETGIPFDGQLTSELVQSVFYPGTPLHDGAVIVREDRVVAAGCVLPLTQDPLPAEKRLGTRHRAAVGLSEKCDGLIVVVSEETGSISVAQYGRLMRKLNRTKLREHLLNFYTPPTQPGLETNRSGLAAYQGWRFWRWQGLQTFFTYGGLFLVSILLGLAMWSFVVEQTNPAQRFRVENIPLRAVDLPPGTTLLTPLPATVSAVVQTTADVRPTLRPGSFQAALSFKGKSPGLHHQLIQVNSGAPQVRILAVDPPTLDLELVEVISRTLPVMVDLPNPQTLSPAYKVIGEPVAQPQQVQVIGPAPLVEKVSRIHTDISLANAGTSLQELRPLRALDQDGHEVAGVTLEPAQVQVNISIQQRPNARDVGVQAVPGGPPPAGYWLSGLSVVPASVTLQGNPDQLAEMGGFVNTVPVNVSQAYGNLEIQVPLDLPAGMQALDSNGNVVRNVTVLARVTPRSGDIVSTRVVELIGLTSGITATVNPPEVELLLSGPLPALQEVEAKPELIQVWVDAGEITPGQSAELQLNLFTPNEIQAQLLPPSVQVAVFEADAPIALKDSVEAVSSR